MAAVNRRTTTGMNDAIAALVRRHDPDRFLTVLFAPAARQDALLLLYALNHELARAREMTSEPALALIRLQWWREVIEGASKRHEVASPLADALAAGALKPRDLLPLIDARELEAYGEFETLAAWRDWLLSGAGGLSLAAASILGAPVPEAFRPSGAAYGVAGVLRATGVLAAQGRCLLPRDLLTSHGLSPESFVADPNAAVAQQVLAEVAAEGRALVREARRVTVPRHVIAAALPVVLARRDLARWPLVVQPRRLGDRMAVTAAGLSGRL